MATPLIEQPTTPIAPVAPVAPVAPAAPVAPVAAPAPAVSTALQTVTPSAVYAAPNIQQIDIPSQRKASDMKLSKLEDKLAKAKSIEELNQIAIMNQPKAMGVLTGEAAYRSKLDTARLGAFNSLYANRLAEEQRKEAKRQQFIQTYGADPKQRPKGMSQREFIKELAAGRQNDKLTTEFKIKQAELAAKQQSLAGGGTTGQTKIANLNSLLEKAAQMPSGGREWAAGVASTYGVTPQAVQQATQQNGWESAYRTPLTAAQQEAAKANEVNPSKTNAQLAVLEGAINSAEGHAGASGRSGARQTFEKWFVGSTDYTNLVAETNTIRTNILTLATDPTIKKFFGPQMSNADVNLMTSAGTMLNPELQSPENLKKSLEQAKDMLRRAKEAVTQGTSQQTTESMPDTMDVNGQIYRRGSDGLYY